MKRGLVLSLCALALGAFANTANAQDVPGSAVKVSLNLRYTDPADPTEGGKFYVVAQSTATAGGFGGLAGLSLYISNINGPTSLFGTPAENGYTASTKTTLADNLSAGTTPYNTTTGGFVNLVYGQDLSAVGFVPVGTIAKGGATPGNTGTDPLKNTAWNNSTVIFSGTFGATRPAFGLVSEANVFSSATAIGKAATLTTTVRGDALASFGLNTPPTAGLLRGDTDRDYDVDANDLNQILLNFGQSGKTWADGDVTDGRAGHVEGQVNANDLNEVLLVFNQSVTPRPAVAAVPEPASIALGAISLIGLFTIRRRA